jgi:type II secretory pathway pseudopilin PulG
MVRICRPDRPTAAFTIVELVVVAAIFALMALALAPFINMAKARSGRMKCANNMREISLALHSYAADHDDAFPARLGDLYPGYVTVRSTFDCPASKSSGTDKEPDYSYAQGLRESSDPKEAIAADLDGNHGKSGKNILRIDGSVEWVGRR